MTASGLETANTALTVSTSSGFVLDAKSPETSATLTVLAPETLLFQIRLSLPLPKAPPPRACLNLLKTTSAISDRSPDLTSRTVSVNDGSNRSEFDAADITISALPGGTNNVDGILVYWVPTGSLGDSANIPLIYFDLAGASADFMGNGGDITIQFNAGGVVQVT